MVKFFDAIRGFSIFDKNGNLIDIKEKVNLVSSAFEVIFKNNKIPENLSKDVLEGLEYIVLFKDYFLNLKDENKNLKEDIEQIFKKINDSKYRIDYKKSELECIFEGIDFFLKENTDFEEYINVLEDDIKSLEEVLAEKDDEIIILKKQISILKSQNPRI